MDSGEGLFGTPLPKRPRKGSNGSVENRLDTGCCQRCEELMTPNGLSQLNSPTGFEHYDRRTAEANAENGCGLCQFISDFAKTTFTGNHVLFLATDEITGMRYDAMTGTLDSVDGQVVLSLVLFARHDDPAAKMVRRRPIVRDVVSEEVWEGARDMIATCQGGGNDDVKLHAKCRSRPKTLLPSRVIHVGTTNDPRTRLQISKPGEQDLYLALSYCWGGDQQLKLKNSTMAGMKQSIDVDKLPRTIQDAIECTRQLGFKYLWVDALCIIQDDGADKEAEIEKMSSVYRNATVTLAASVATKAAEGFLRLQRTYEPESRFQFPMPYGRIGTVFLTQSTKYTPEHPLDTRAWALQEFLLSPRLLIYSDYELLWQCHSVELRSVTSGKLDYLQPLEEMPFGIFGDDDVELATSVYGGSSLERYYKWRTIVEQYTDRAVSHPDDRISAVQGVAKELSRLWDDQYLWGLFRSWFIGLLAWYPPERSMNRSQRAPSWSWLCLDGSIRFQEQLAHEDAVLLQENLLTLRSSRAVALKAKLLPCSATTDKDRADINEHRDLLRNEGVGDAAHYLLLGYYEEQVSRGYSTDSDDEWADIGSECEEVRQIGIGLVVLEAESASGYFTRAGCAEFFEMRLWDAAPSKRIILT